VKEKARLVGGPGLFYFLRTEFRQLTGSGVGLELPTGKKEAPTQIQINAPAFVRQQQLMEVCGHTSISPSHRLVGDSFLAGMLKRFSALSGLGLTLCSR
jgi:hypothetical protein